MHRRTSSSDILSPVRFSHALTSPASHVPQLFSSKHAKASSMSGSGSSGARCDARSVTNEVKLRGPAAEWGGEGAEEEEEGAGRAWRREWSSVGSGCWPVGRDTRGSE